MRVQTGLLLVLSLCAVDLTFGWSSRLRIEKHSIRRRQSLVLTAQGGPSPSTTTTVAPDLSSEDEENEINSDFCPRILQLGLAGFLATLAGDVSMHPMDCVKTLQQSDEYVGRSMLQTVGELYGNEGIGGFYRGLWTYAASDAGGGAIKFATYEMLKQYVVGNNRWSIFRQRDRRSDEEVQLKQSAALFVCAGIAFLASSVVIVPGEFLKQQLQMGFYPDLPAAVVSIFSSPSGISGFFVGYDGVIIRDVPYTMLQLGLYDLFKMIYGGMRENSLSETLEDKADDSSDKLNTFEAIVAAAITGAITAYLTTPLDTVKAKVMVDGYASFFDAWQVTVQGGYPSLFAGSTARVLWLIPFTTIYLPVYDLLKDRFVGNNNTLSTSR